jgi:signal transduction histidine kinase
MIIPVVMVFLSLALKSKLNRRVNIILGVLYTFVNISNLIGETWIFYIAFVVVEIALTLLIIGFAWKWSNPETLVPADEVARTSASAGAAIHQLEPGRK